MKILQIIPSLHLAGAEKMVLQLSAALKKMHPEIKLRIISFYHTPENRFMALAREAGCELLELNKRKGFDPGFLRRLRQEIKAFQPNVIHSHIGALRYCALAIMGLNIPVKVHTIHSLPSKESPSWQKYFNCLLFGKMKWIPVVLSRGLMKECESYYSVSPQVIPNGVEVKVIQGNASFLREKLGISKGAKVILNVGRLSPAKNQLNLVRAMRLIKHEDVVLLIAGSGRGNEETEKNIRREIESLPVEVKQRIQLLGEVEDINELLNMCDLFILPSLYEGMPMSILEAMSLGKPVAASPVGSIPEMLSEHEGYFINNPSAEEIARVINEVFSDYAAAQEKGIKAKRRFFEEFTVEKMARNYMQLYGRRGASVPERCKNNPE